MASTRTATLTFRIEPELKEAVRTAAVNEHRSIANMIVVMIRDCCGRVGIEITEPSAYSLTRPPLTNSKRYRTKSK